MKKKLIIIGAGDFAEIAHEYFSENGEYEVVAFCVEKRYIKHQTINGITVIPYEELKVLFPPSEFYLFTAISSTLLNTLRKRFYFETKLMGYNFATYISPKAFVWHNVKIGENCFIFEGNILQYNVEIGNNVILWSNNTIGHRAKIKDHCFISSNVVVAGFSEIGEGSFIGINASIPDLIKIAENNFIIAGSVLLENTLPNKVYKGNPAKPELIDSIKFSKIRHLIIKSDLEES
ncbi:MAG: acetyltransferase [Bacteroidia bacterium]|nr:acetyltransferase [Bacteroidia bacterium]